MEPIVSPASQLFPALLIATANLRADVPGGAEVLGDPHGMVGVAVAATRDDQHARISVDAPGLGRPSSIEVVLPRAGTWYQVYPTMQWDYARLHAVRRAAPGTLEFAVELDGHAPARKAQRVRVRAVNEAPYSIDAGGERTDLSWMFAAYVDEEHPLVQRILGEALASGAVERFDGYQSGDPEQGLPAGVRDLAGAGPARHPLLVDRAHLADRPRGAVPIRALPRRELGEPPGELRRRLGAAGLGAAPDRPRPAAGAGPGHMFLAFALDAEGTQYAYLETTRLGAAGARASAGALLGNFESAVEEGLVRYEQGAARFGRADSPEYRIIDVGAARRQGVAPIAVR